MSAAGITVTVLLAVAVGVELLCCLGVLVMDSVFDRLHYLGPATTLGPLALVLAVLVQHSSAQAVIKVLLIGMTLLATGPVLTHATARAARVRESGGLDVPAPREGSQP